MITRKVVMLGEVISDAESEKLHPGGFFCFRTDDGQRMYASYSDWSVTKVLRPGQRIEAVSVMYSYWPWGKKRTGKMYVRVVRQPRQRRG